MKHIVDENAMLVKSISTGDTKTIDVTGKVQTNVALSSALSLITNDKVTPKVSFIGTDPHMNNIYARRG
jgi:hypothetical protein